MIEVVHIVARVTTDMTRFNAGMASMEARAKTATAKMSLAGMRMTKYLTLPIAGIAYAGVKTATSFEKSMTLIRTQAGATARDIPKIQKAILAMSGNTVMQGPKDLADAYYHLQSVFGNTTKGADTVAKKIKILTGVAHLAQVGGSDIESTTSAVAGIMRTHLKGATTIMQVVRTINGIVGSGNMRMPEFVESTGTAVLQVARLLGMSLKQVGAAEAVFTDENMNANMSMTRLRTSLMMAVNPSDAARKKMQALGISSLEIGKRMRGKNGFGNTLDYLSAAYDRYVTTLERRGKSAAAAKTLASGLLFGSFGGSKGASVWATLVQQHQMFHQKEQQIGAKEKNFNKDLAASNETLAVKFSKAWARIQVALRNFGVAVAPTVLGFLHVLVRLANAFSALPTPIQHFVAAVSIGLAALGPMLIMLSSIIKIFGDVGALLGTGGAVSAGFGAILPLAVIAGVGALVYFAMKSKWFRLWIKHEFKQVAGFFKWLGKDVLIPAAKDFYHFWADGGAASRWALQVKPALQTVGFILRGLAHAVKQIMGFLGKLFTSYFPRFGSWLGSHAEQLAEILGYNPGGFKGYNHRDKMLVAMGQAHAKGNMKRYRQLQREYRGQYGDNSPSTRHHHRGRAGGGAVAANMAYMVGENGPEWFVPGQSGNITRRPGGDMRGDSPLVHIAEMHVRHESDAEIVSGKIARKVMIP